jgi:hypothetical protein
MDQPATLDALQEVLEPGGGVAIVTDHEWMVRGQAAWHAAVYEVAERYLDDLPTREDPAEVEYEDPWTEMLADHGFRDVTEVKIPLAREWSTDEIVDYVFSLSYCSPATFGDEKDAFEMALRERLAELCGGPFSQETDV